MFCSPNFQFCFLLKPVLVTYEIEGEVVTKYLTLVKSGNDMIFIDVEHVNVRAYFNNHLKNNFTYSFKLP